MFGQITELAKAQGVCDIKVIQISATHMKTYGAVVLLLSLLHNFIQLNLNSGSAQIQFTKISAMHLEGILPSTRK